MHNILMLLYSLISIKAIAAIGLATIGYIVFSIVVATTTKASTIPGVTWTDSNNNSATNTATTNVDLTTNVVDSATSNLIINYGDITIDGASNLSISANGNVNNSYTKNQTMTKFDDDIYPYITSSVALSGLRYSPFHKNSAAVAVGNIKGFYSVAAGAQFELRKNLFINAGFSKSVNVKQGLASTIGIGLKF